MTVEVHYDSDATAKNEIETYMLCALCMQDLPEGISPKHWARTQTGVRSDGRIQVWCNRHETNVVILDFKVKR